MCLITFNWKNHPKYKLILVANRDEFFQRPSAPLHKWESGFYAGKDLKAGGTWMGVHPNGRFAALTNYRDLKNLKKNPKTRGNLVKDFLEGGSSPFDFLKRVALEKDDYEGFNLLVGEGDSVFYFSNYKEGIEEIEPGTYGLSNALLDTPWTKLTLAKSKLRQSIANDMLDPVQLMQVVHSKKMDPEELLPDTGATLYQEKHLSAQFIKIDDYYGTVNTTVLLWGNDGKIEVFERTFDQINDVTSDQKVSIQVCE
ncbi:NRDE family protein [Belliella sp. DSM 111904]|uniref:NRDE family protein n=1 Tax=Belliella filtrata TaxID=2923435 RepID=A0ABS9UXB3_9BACT|nr:NRDE family protein [Belliella filtrata]MCH7408754.1 NRDE family protein [Belliella filtrata]